MKKIDFFYEKRDLHRKMYDAIKQLVLMTKDGIVKINNSDEYCFTAYAYFEPDGYSSVNGVMVDAVRYDGCLEVHDDGFDIESQFSWFAIGEGSDGVGCTIDSIYDSVWNAIVKDDGFELIKHGETKYLCRYVHSSEVGITDIDDNILIAPESLLYSMKYEYGSAVENIDNRVYYYAKDDIMDLPYKEFCDKLKESGID